MLVYKALYKKMMDDLKDAGMWIDWAEQIHESNPQIAKYLLDSAKERIEESFPETYEHFKNVCKDATGKGDVCINDVVHDHIMEWCHALKMKLDHMEK